MEKLITAAGALLLVATLAILVGAGVNTPSLQQSVTSVEIPAPTGYVNDKADIISPAVEASLEARLKAVADTGKAEIAVLTINSTSPYDITQYGIRLGDAWKVGDSKEDNGVIFIVAVGDRQVRIEVGSGAEAFLTDAQAGRILDNSVVPVFKTGNWEAGITAGVDEIIKAANK